MALFRKMGNVLGRAASNHISQGISSSTPSIFQAIRCMSSSKIFVGGLSFSTDDSSLKDAFSEYGAVAEARVIVDRETGRSKGFGFVTYSSVDEATAAIQAMNQQELHGRTLKVNYATDRVRGYGGGRRWRWRWWILIVGMKVSEVELNYVFCLLHFFNFGVLLNRHSVFISVM